MREIRKHTQFVCALVSDAKMQRSILTAQKRNAEDTQILRMPPQDVFEINSNPKGVILQVSVPPGQEEALRGFEREVVHEGGSVPSHAIAKRKLADISGTDAAGDKTHIAYYSASPHLIEMLISHGMASSEEAIHLLYEYNQMSLAALNARRK